MKKVLSYAATVLFVIAYPFAMISTSVFVDNQYFKFHSVLFTYSRYIIIILLMIILTYLNRKREALFTVFVPLAMVAVTFGIYIEYFVTRHYLYNYGYLLWACVAFSVANAGVFIGVTLFTEDYYLSFSKRFWISYLFIYLLIIYVAFIRTPNTGTTSLNLRLGNGTIQFFPAIFKGLRDSLYVSLVCFGNIMILFPVPFIISSIKRLPLPVMLIIGIMIPLFFESYQYLLKCGNADVDDFVLNFTGYMLGLFIETVICKKKIKESP